MPTLFLFYNSFGFFVALLKPTFSGAQALTAPRSVSSCSFVSRARLCSWPSTRSTPSCNRLDPKLYPPKKERTQSYGPNIQLYLKYHIIIYYNIPISITQICSVPKNGHELHIYMVQPEDPIVQFITGPFRSTSRRRTSEAKPSAQASARSRRPSQMAWKDNRHKLVDFDVDGFYYALLMLYYDSDVIVTKL